MKFNLGEAIGVGLHMTGLSQRELAERIKVTEQHISCLANNRYGTTFETAEKIADVFGVCLSKFITWGE